MTGLVGMSGGGRPLLPHRARDTVPPLQSGTKRRQRGILLANAAATLQDQVVQIYYDLRLAPLTFDAATFFAIAVARLRAKGYRHFNVHIVALGYRNVTDRDKSYTAETRQWRLINIILKLPLLIPGVMNVYLCRSLPVLLGDPRYPHDYDASKPVVFPYSPGYLFEAGRAGANIQVYEATPYARAWARDRLGEGKTIVIALRKAEFSAERNTPEDMWHQLYEHLVCKGYRVFIVPDQYDTLYTRSFGRYGANVIPEAAIDLDLRLALYQECYANLAWSGGHTSLLMASDARFLMFGLVIRNSTIQANTAFYESRNMRVGEHPDFFPPTQQLDWTDASDLTAEGLIASCERYLADLERLGAV